MLYLRGGGEVADLTGLFETLSVKIGIVMLVLGVIHFVNVMVFSSMRRRGRTDAARAQYAQQAHAALHGLPARTSALSPAGRIDWPP